MRQSVLVRVNPNEASDRRKAMMMVPVSEALKDLLCRQGMSAGSGGTDDALEIDAGEPGKLNPAIGHRHGGETGPMGMGLEKDAGQVPRQFTGRRQTEGETTLMVAIATMKSARVVRTAPLMLIMDGGKS